MTRRRASIALAVALAALAGIALFLSLSQQIEPPGRSPLGSGPTQPHSGQVSQITRGDCSPAIAYVSGNVTIVCNNGGGLYVGELTEDVVVGAMFLKGAK